MTKFWIKLKGWFKPRSIPFPRFHSSYPLTKLELKAKPKPVSYRPINYRHYRQLIGKLARQAIAEQRARQRRKC